MSGSRELWMAVATGVVAGLAVMRYQPSLEMLAAAAVAGVGAAMILSRPFLGIFILVTLLQQVTWTRVAFSRLPVSFIEAMVALIVGGILMARLRRPKVEPLLPEDRVLRLGVLFIGVAALSLLLNAQQLRAGQAELQKFISYMVLVLLTVHLTRSTRQVRALVLALVISTTISTGVVVMERYAGIKIGPQEAPITTKVGMNQSQRLSGSSAIAGTSAKMMVGGTVLAGLMFLVFPYWRPLTGVTAGLGVVALPITGTRTALLVLVIAVVWIVFQFRRHRRIGLVLAAAPAVVLVVLLVTPASTFSRLASLKDPGSDSTTNIRVAMYTVGLDLFRQHPILGVGPGQFEVLWTGFEYRWEEGTLPQPLHNAYLGVAVDTGLAGLALFIAMLVGAWTSLRWARMHAAEVELRGLARVVNVGFVIYLITAMTGPGHRQMYLWVLIAIALAIGKVARRSVMAREDGLLADPGEGTPLANAAPRSLQAVPYPSN